MSQEATRSAPPSTGDETSEGALAPIAAETFPPLALLLEEVRSPGRVPADVDALIVGLGRPPSADESLRERADLLLGLLDRSNAVGDHVGSGGMKVRHAAKEALLALGYPYAMELPPELLEKEGLALKEEPQNTGKIVIAALSVLYQSGALFLLQQLGNSFKMSEDTFLSVTGGGIWLVTLCAVLGHLERSRDMQLLGSVGLWVMAVGWGLLSLLGAMFTGGLALVFLPWHLALWTAIALRPQPAPKESPDPPAPRPTP